MREFKFRAWDKILKIWYPIDGTDTFSIFENNRFEVMQYTGLKDINGVDIYEGDILENHYKSIEVKQPELFECDAFIVYGYDFCSGFFNDGKIELERFYSTGPKVIGNIYENPELLEK